MQNNNLSNNSSEINPRDCIIVNDILKNDDETYILLSEIFMQKDMIIKVMKNIYNPYLNSIYKTLYNHEYFNIVPIYGFTHCKDDFKNLKLTLMEKGICDGTDNNQINLLIMKEIKEEKIDFKKLSTKQLASIFFQIIITSLVLYKETDIIHTDIKLDNFKITKTLHDSEKYTTRHPSINIIVKLHGHRVYLIDFDNGIIEKKTYLFVEDVINTCKNFFNAYPIITSDTYNLLINDLKNYKNDLERVNINKLDVVKKVYKMLLKYLNPIIGNDVIIILDY